MRLVTWIGLTLRVVLLQQRAQIEVRHAPDRRAAQLRQVREV